MPAPFALMWVVAAAATPATTLIEACRTAHAQDPDARIACLEDALRGGPPRPAGSLGVDQIESRQRAGNPEPERETVRLVSVAYDAAGRGVFRTESGQVWRESALMPEHLRLKPGREYQARIERGALSGYRMYVEGERGMLKVERLE